MLAAVAKTWVIASESSRPHPLAHSSAYGTADAKSHWSWPAAVATVQNIDEVESITFHSSLGAGAPAVHNHAAAKTAHTIQGLRWSSGALPAGFLALAVTNRATTTDRQHLFKERRSCALKLAAAGATRARIADQLGISDATV